MNKLIIIGNGFDLAHGLPTSYGDFILWEINEAFKKCINHKKIVSGLFELTSEEHIYNRLDSTQPFIFLSITDFLDFIKEYDSKYQTITLNYKYTFIEKLMDIFKTGKQNWVDIEKEYFKELIGIQTANINDASRKKMLTQLNESIDIIKQELSKYLYVISNRKISVNNEIAYHFEEIFGEINDENPYKNPTMILNFNYTSTIENYVYKYLQPNISTNYIHGKLRNYKNPIIFGYGDETDQNYSKLEDLDENEFLKHMKSFAYLQTPNYKILFDFINGKDELFDVYIMGHSCGLSDRLLFTHIFEHANLNSVKIYFHQKSNDENDFYEKTQNLSRYFRLDSKHKMRTKVIPFSESRPLTSYTPTNQN